MDEIVAKPLEVPTEEQPKQPKPSKRRTRSVDLANLEKRAKTVLDREINYLLDMSYDGKLDKDGAACLINYLKAIKDLRKDVDRAPETYEIDIPT